jgi:sucrose phosphorylase
MSEPSGIRETLDRIYGEEKGRLAFDRIAGLIQGFPRRKSDRPPGGYFSQQDVVLITYGDTLRREEELPLDTFRAFAMRYLKGAVSAVHFLPFFPYSSDDGFSVIDFLAVDPELGSWKEIDAIGGEFELMFDFVLNHFSSKSGWFESYLNEEEAYRDFVIEVDPSADLSKVTRPRSLPLLTPYRKRNGRTAHVWTTFSPDQIDFNYRSLSVLEKMIEVLLFYVKRGAKLLRMDAVAYLWKEIGTSCIHLPQAHEMIKLFRKILDCAAPETIVVTETNVPHRENISYFGNGRDEAQMVYNFTLPPLLFHSFVEQDASVLSDWAKTLSTPSENTTFFNFTASHDGIGVRPLEGILPKSEVERLIQIVRTNNGRVSCRKNPDGTESPYELNITYIDAILGGASSKRAEKFLASQAVQYSLPGVPGTYIHSLLGSRNWLEGFEKTQHARTLNREKLTFDTVVSELNDPGSFRSRVFFPYLQMMRIRRLQPAFHPNADFEVLDIDRRIFCIRRRCKDQTLFALANLSAEEAPVSLPESAPGGRMEDVLSGKRFVVGRFLMRPYQYLWLSDRPVVRHDRMAS